MYDSLIAHPWILYSRLKLVGKDRYFFQIAGKHTLKYFEGQFTVYWSCRIFISTNIKKITTTILFFAIQHLQHICVVFKWISLILLVCVNMCYHKWNSIINCTVPTKFYRNEYLHDKEPLLAAKVSFSSNKYLSPFQVKTHGAGSLQIQMDSENNFLVTWSACEGH